MKTGGWIKEQMQKLGFVELVEMLKGPEKEVIGNLEQH